MNPSLPKIGDCFQVIAGRGFQPSAHWAKPSLPPRDGDLHVDLERFSEGPIG
jgi:hypothetical protein